MQHPMILYSINFGTEKCEQPGEIRRCVGNSKPLVALDKYCLRMP